MKKITTTLLLLSFAISMMAPLAEAKYRGSRSYRSSSRTKSYSSSSRTKTKVVPTKKVTKPKIKTTTKLKTKTVAKPKVTKTKPKTKPTIKKKTAKKKTTTSSSTRVVTQPATRSFSPFSSNFFMYMWMYQMFKNNDEPSETNKVVEPEEAKK